MHGGWRPLAPGKRFVFQHNDMESFEKQLVRAKNLTEQTGGILVVTEGSSEWQGTKASSQRFANTRKSISSVSLSTTPMALAPWEKMDVV